MSGTNHRVLTFPTAPPGSARDSASGSRRARGSRAGRGRQTRSTALYVSLNFDIYETEGELYGRDLAIDGVPYRRLDPEYYAWNLFHHCWDLRWLHAGKSDGTEFEKASRRFAAIHVWAEEHFGEEALRAAVGRFDPQKYSPPPTTVRSDRFPKGAPKLQSANLVVEEIPKKARTPRRPAAPPAWPDLQETVICPSLPGEGALYVSTDLCFWGTDAAQATKQDVRRGGRVYRRLDPEYFAWLSGGVDRVAAGFESGAVSRALRDEVVMRFTTVRFWAEREFGTERLAEAVRAFNLVSYVPPAGAR